MLGDGNLLSFSVYFNLREIRTLIYMHLLLFSLGGYSFLLGAMEIRYSVARIFPIEFFESWNFYLAIAMPIASTVFLMHYVVHIMTKSRPATSIGYVGIIIAGAQLAWNLVCVAVNLPVWVNCNDGGLTAPRHPECINRNYPTDTLPDWTFMIMVIGSGVLALMGLFDILLYWNGNTSASTNLNAAVNYGGIGTHMHKAKVSDDDQPPSYLEFGDRDVSEGYKSQLGDD